MRRGAAAAGAARRAGAVPCAMYRKDGGRPPVHRAAARLLQGGRQGGLPGGARRAHDRESSAGGAPGCWPPSPAIFGRTALQLAARPRTPPARAQWELVEGLDLLETISQTRGGRPFTEREARHYFRQLLEAVCTIHRLGFAHRDIKPENVMLCTNSNTIKLIDFGLSKHIESARRHGHCRRRRRHFHRPPFSHLARLTARRRRRSWSAPSTSWRAPSHTRPPPPLPPLPMLHMRRERMRRACGAAGARAAAPRPRRAAARDGAVQRAPRGAHSSRTPVHPTSSERGCEGAERGRQDVWALGCTLFLMVTGQHAFEDPKAPNNCAAAPPRRAHNRALPPF